MSNEYPENLVPDLDQKAQKLAKYLRDKIAELNSIKRSYHDAKRETRIQKRG